MTAFLRDTNLADVNLLSDSDLLSRLQSPRLLICHWDSTLSLAHPRLSVLLDDLDERLRRFVRYHHLDDKEYSKKEDQELAELEEGHTTRETQAHHTNTCHTLGTATQPVFLCGFVSSLFVCLLQRSCSFASPCVAVALCMASVSSRVMRSRRKRFKQRSKLDSIPYRHQPNSYWLYSNYRQCYSATASSRTYSTRQMYDRDTHDTSSVASCALDSHSLTPSLLSPFVCFSGSFPF